MLRIFSSRDGTSLILAGTKNLNNLTVVTDRQLLKFFVNFHFVCFGNFFLKKYAPLLKNERSMIVSKKGEKDQVVTQAVSPFNYYQTEWIN